jgi:type I restriction enzyme R subunit/putative DNA methylase
MEFWNERLPWERRAPARQVVKALKNTPPWRSRGYLPHFDTPGALQSITFRLADSLPQAKLASLEKELSLLPPKSADVARRKKIEEWLDAGTGCCALRHPQVADIVQETLLKYDGERYKLIVWCVMPNHVHVLIEANNSLGRIVQSWKSYTGRWALGKNAELGLGAPGKTFLDAGVLGSLYTGYYHFKAAAEYIHRNPIAAGLCRTDVEWS